jgi:DNA topoisomerase-1
VDPVSGLKVSLRKGPYGHYVQLGENGAPAPVKVDETKTDEAAAVESPTGEAAEGKAPKGKAKAKRKPAKEKLPKPKRVSLPQGMVPSEVDLDRGLALLALPRELGPHPEDREMITAGIGRFGPYLKHGPVYKSLAKDDDVLSIGLNRAISLLAEPKGANRRGGAPGKPLGNHPADGTPVTLHEGRYGPYVKHGKVNATLPKSLPPDQVTLEQAVPLLAERLAKTGGKPPAKGRKTSFRQPAAKPAGVANDDAAPSPRKRAAASQKRPPRKTKKPESE